MNKEIFKSISIRGRVAYCVKCLSLYCKEVYPNTDFSSVIDYAARIVDGSDYIDIGALRFMEIIPEYLYEFDNYEDAEFEYISKDEFNQFRQIVPENDSELNSLMHRVYDIAYEYCYEAMEPSAPKTIPYISEVNRILKSHKIALPSIEPFAKSSFSESDGWGHSIDRTNYL